MNSVIGDLLPLAIGVAVSPVPIIAVILMLLAPRAKAASIAFAGGWVIGVSATVAVVTLLVHPAGSADPGDPSLVASVVKLVLGGLSIALAVHQWRTRPREGTTPQLPAWMSAIDSLTPMKAFGLALLLSAANPKNLALCASAGTTVGGASPSPGATVVCLVVFVVLASLSVAAPVLGYLVARERLAGPLNDLRGWLTANNNTVMAVLLGVLGTVQLGKGIGGL